jgi:hypothetical protein
MAFLRWFKITRQKFGELRVTASAFGVYAGLLGIEHGFFETLQGNIAPRSVRIRAVNPWELPFPFGHEPAVTLVPNLLLTGILAMIVGLSVIMWSTTFIQKKAGAVVLFLLSIVLFLVGGGFGPMSLLIPACIAAAGINRPFTWWRAHLPANGRQLLALLWPWCFIVALLWVPAEFVVGYTFGVKNDAHLNLVLCYPLVGFFALTLITGLACEVRTQNEVHPQAVAPA